MRYLQTLKISSKIVWSVLFGLQILAFQGFSAPTAAADTLASQQIREKITGKRIYLATPLGGEFPLYYKINGEVNGSGEASGLGRWVKPKDQGRWWVSDDKLCQKWQTWYEGRTICFSLRHLGNNKLAWTQDNGDTGTARIGD
jgi:hypothetical protein